MKPKKKSPGPSAPEAEIDRALLESAAWLNRHLAEDLHESICQSLAGTSLLAHALLRRLRLGREIPEADLKRIATSLEDAIDQTRGIVQPPAFGSERGVLAQALAELARLTSRKIPCAFVHSGEREISDPQATFAFYLIAQEAIRNALRHGRAREIRLSLTGTAGDKILEIHDEGAGFSPGRRLHGHGLRMMDHFARAVGARLEIKSSPKKGTLVRCSIRLGPSPKI